QSFQAGTFFHTSPAVWQSPIGELIYEWGAADVGKIFKFDGATFETAPLSSTAASADFPGAFLTVSANGSTACTGVLLATMLSAAQDGSAVLRAFDGTDLTRELWNSDQNLARDGAGSFAKFLVPTVANGKVYLGTFSNRVEVYGLLSQ